MSKKAVNVSVRPRGRNDNPMRMIKRFMKKVKKMKILEIHRDGLRYTKPSEKKTTKKEKSKGFKKTRRREQNKRQLEIKKLIIE